VTEVKKILYSTIESIGKERIRADTTPNINYSEKYMDTIMAEFIAKINDDSSVSNKDETIVVLTGGLLHFMIMYGLFPKAGSINNNYSNIIIDINNFLKETGDKSFRFIH
jgi:hypothetical protein